ncbi:MAG: hypothetical protein Q8Q52_07350, partial [Acidimicrobiia bacterium]|nr:hypothetical protein [Acidimicrobiia bacterium]
TLARLAKRHAQFQTHLAPRGWALSESVQRDGSYQIALDAVEKAGMAAELFDPWLAKQLLPTSGVERLVAKIASFPLGEVWRWTFVVGEAAQAMRTGLVAPAAFSWFVVSEGLWKDVQELIGSERPRFLFRRGSAEQHPVSERLTWSWESLRVAIDALASAERRTFVEPIDTAPTSRHALLHGQVSGAIHLHHAVKTFTVVEALVEQFQALRTLLPSDRLVLPPWA